MSRATTLWCRQGFWVAFGLVALSLGLSLPGSSHAAQPKRRRFPDAPRPSMHVQNAVRLVRDSSVQGLKWGAFGAVAYLGNELVAHFMDVPPEMREPIRQHIRLFGESAFTIAAVRQAYRSAQELLPRHRVEDIDINAFIGGCIGIVAGALEATGHIDVGIAQSLDLPQWSDALTTAAMAGFGVFGGAQAAHTAYNIFQDDYDPLFHRVWESLRLPESTGERWRNLGLASLFGLGQGALIASGLDAPLDNIRVQLFLAVNSLGMVGIEALRQGINVTRIKSEAFNDAYEVAAHHLLLRPFLFSLLGVPSGLAIPVFSRLLNDYPMAWSEGTPFGIAAGIALSGVISLGQAAGSTIRVAPAVFQSVRTKIASQWAKGEAWKQSRQNRKEAEQLLQTLQADENAPPGSLSGDWTTDKETLSKAIHRLTLLQVHPVGGDYQTELSTLTRLFYELENYHDPLESP